MKITTTNIFLYYGQKAAEKSPTEISVTLKIIGMKIRKTWGLPWSNGSSALTVTGRSAVHILPNLFPNQPKGQSGKRSQVEKWKTKPVEA